MYQLYDGIVNSPETELTQNISSTDTTISVKDASKLPAPPNLAVIGRNEDAETILYTGKSGNTLTGVTRGFQGQAKSWKAGAPVARRFTEYDWRAIKDNLLRYTVQHVINVKGFGAKGDGVTDDTQAIKDALAAAVVAKAPVYFPPGTYIISSSLTISHWNTVIRGAGKDQTILKMTTDQDAIVLLRNGGASSLEYVELHDFSITTTVPNPTRYGLYMKYVNHGYFKGLKITGFFVNYKIDANCWVNRFVDCESYLAKEDGWDIGIEAHNTTLINCISNRSGRRGFNIQKAVPIQLIGCLAEMNTGDGFYVYKDANDVSFIGCMAEYNRYAFQIGAAQVGPNVNAVSLIGCSTHGESLGAVTAANYNRLVLIGNRFRNTPVGVDVPSTAPPVIDIANEFIEVSTPIKNSGTVVPTSYRTLSFFMDNVAAGMNGMLLSKGMGAINHYVMPHGGSIVGVAVYSNQSRSSGTLTIEVLKNGQPTGLSVTLDGTKSFVNTTTALPGAYPFAPTDRIGARITTSSDWSPTTASIAVEVAVAV